MPKPNLRVSVRMSAVLSLAFLFLSAAAFAQTAKSTDTASASLAGTWNMVSETQDGDSLSWTLIISQTDGHWAGTINSDNGKTPATGFKVSGDKVHFQTEYQGNSYDINLVLTAGALTGTWSGESGSGKTTGKRAS